MPALSRRAISEARGDIYYAKGDKAAALTRIPHRAPGCRPAGTVDSDLLDLKINDLPAERRRPRLLPPHLQMK